MIDFFDIIDKTRNKNIRMKGIVSDYSHLTYTTEDLNKFVSIIISEKDNIDTVKFDISSDTCLEDATFDDGLYSGYRTRRSSGNTITFDIDIYMNSSLYNRLYEDFENIIDYFTPGSITYNYDSEFSLTTDSRIEYITPDGDRVSSNVNITLENLYTDQPSNIHINHPIDWNSVIDRNWWRDASDMIRSPYLNHDHDADGDTAVLAAEFTATDLSDMFVSSNPLTNDSFSLGSFAPPTDLSDMFVDARPVIHGDLSDVQRLRIERSINEEVRDSERYFRGGRN